MKRAIAFLFLYVLSATLAAGQCAMCKTTLANNVSNGDLGIAAGINTGILYLFFAPYLAVAVIFYLWYRTSKSNEQEELPKRSAFR